MTESTQSTESESDRLWRFTCAWWKENRVESICLDWQNRFELDASVFVWVAWVAGMRRHRLSQREVQRALAHVKDWRENVIAPVRKARKALRELDPGLTGAHADSIYAGLRSIELKSERSEQLTLLTWRLQEDGGGDVSVSNVHQNMSVYLGCLNASLSEADTQNLVFVANKANKLLDEMSGVIKAASIDR